MRIVHLIHQFLPYGIGGSEVYVYELSQEQRKHHQVAVFSAWRNPELPDYTLHHGFYEEIPVFRLVNNYGEVHSFQEGYDHPKINEIFESFVKEFKPDVVHIHHLSNLSFGIVRILKQMGIPTLMTLHDFWMVCPRGQRLRPTMERCDRIDLKQCARCIQPWLNGFDHSSKEQQDDVRKRYHAALETLNNINRLITPSLFLKKEFVKLGIPPTKIIFMENGRNRDKYHQGEKKPNGNKRFAYLGSLIPSKGVHVLLEAWKEFKDPDATLTIYGAQAPYDGWDRYGEHLKNLTAGDNRIHWKGAYDPMDTANILSEVDTLIIPSIWHENAPMTLQEAQMSGTFVIASRIGGIVEKVIPNENGILFEPGSISGLSVALQTCSDNIKKIREIKMTFPVPTINEHDQGLEAWYKKCEISGI